MKLELDEGRTLTIATDISNTQKYKEILDSVNKKFGSKIGPANFFRGSKNCWHKKNLRQKKFE